MWSRAWLSLSLSRRVFVDIEVCRLGGRDGTRDRDRWSTGAASALAKPSGAIRTESLDRNALPGILR